MAKTNVWCWGSKLPVEVSDNGEIDDNARRAFTCGQCHALALAIHEQTGWPIAGLVSALDDDTPSMPGHVVVVTPDGDTVDINGRGALKRWKSHVFRTDIKLVPTTPGKIKRFKGYMKPDVEVARPFVSNVLKMVGIILPKQLKLFVANEGTYEENRIARASGSGAVSVPDVLLPSAKKQQVGKPGRSRSTSASEGTNKKAHR
jgi:hypothetical protein